VGAGKAVCSAPGGATAPTSAGYIAIGAVLDVYDAPPVALGAGGRREVAGARGANGGERARTDGYTAPKMAGDNGRGVVLHIY
jgi:hypothetical protein